MNQDSPHPEPDRSISELPALTEAGRLAKNLNQQDLVFIYVHGFGEFDVIPPFEKKLRRFLKPLPLKTAVVTYRWDSLRINLSRIVHQWGQAKGRAEEAGKSLARELTAFDATGVPYAIIGYSMGCRVAADALKHGVAPLARLRGITFLGAALPHDAVPDGPLLPEGMKISSYYSKRFDTVLKVPFYNAEGTKAGGEVGFDDHRKFQNYRTVCTHLYKGGPIQRDYSNLASAIGYLALWREKIFVAGRAAHLSPGGRSVHSGRLQWNDILSIEADPEPILIQQNVLTRSYRAVIKGRDARRARLARGRNLHMLIRELGLFEQETAVAGQEIPAMACDSSGVQ